MLVQTSHAACARLSVEPGCTQPYVLDQEENNLKRVFGLSSRAHDCVMREKRTAAIMNECKTYHRF